MRILPNFIYESLSGGEQVASEGQVFYIADRIEIVVDYDIYILRLHDNVAKLEKTDRKNPYAQYAIYQWLQGAEYPQKGYPQAESIFNVNVAKRLMIQGLKYFSKHLYALPFTTKGVENLLQSYNEVSLKIISADVLNTSFLTSLSLELGKLTTTFLYNIGISEKVAVDFGKIIACMFEYDNAYRFRIQDLFHASTKEAMIKNPYKEISRLLVLSKERDSEGVSVKFRYIKPLLFIAFLIPRVKRQFIKTLELIDFSKLQFDEIDLYWVSMRTDYNFLGMEAQERADIYLKDKKMPTPMTQQDYQDYINKKNA